MTDEPLTPIGRKVVEPSHRLSNEDWAKVVAEAAEIRRQQEEEAGGEDEARRLGAGLLAPARRITKAVDMTAAGRNCGKYFPVSGIPTQLIVFHSMECPLQAGYARSLTNWALTPESAGGPQASWHRGYGPDERVYFIPDELGAWHASEANPLSIGLEQTGYAAYTRAQWTTAAGMAMLDGVAVDVAAICKRDGIPARWLTTAEVRAVLDSGNRSIKGFCMHRQVDPETRTDPGNGYPADILLAKVKAILAPPAAPEGWYDVATPAQVEASIKKVVEPLVKNYGWWYHGSAEKDNAYAALRGAPKLTWAQTVTRGGQKISALQELADSKTLGMQNAAAIEKLQATLDQILKAVGATPAPAPAAKLERPQEVIVDLGEVEPPAMTAPQLRELDAPEDPGEE